MRYKNMSPGSAIIKFFNFFKLWRINKNDKASTRY
jgi:hypothetical protein